MGEEFYFAEKIFGALPSPCKVFDLIEIFDDTGPFETKGIKRNREDVYFVVL